MAKKGNTWLGHITMSVSLLAVCFWAYWGIIETFHEGWYSETLYENALNMFGQYLSPMIILILLSVLSIFKNKIGAVVFLLTGILIGVLIQNRVLVLPFLILAIMFWYSDLNQKKVWTVLIVGTPLIITLVLGIPNYIRVDNRFNDNDFTQKLIKGNGVELIWAPEGPGFPENGTSWNNAIVICKYLSEDGLAILDEPQNKWRLPTADEMVRSLTKANKNSGGTLDTVRFVAEYKTTPDKESPIWKVHSKVIYMWTATEIDSTHAYMIAYDGKLWSRNKKYAANYLGFRAVKIE